MLISMTYSQILHNHHIILCSKLFFWWQKSKNPSLVYWTLSYLVDMTFTHVPYNRFIVRFMRALVKFCKYICNVYVYLTAWCNLKWKWIRFWPYRIQHKLRAQIYNRFVREAGQQKFQVHWPFVFAILLVMLHLFICCFMQMCSYKITYIHNTLYRFHVCGVYSVQRVTIFNKVG